MATTDSDELVMAGARVDPELHRRIRIAAARNEQTMADYLRELLDEHVPDE